MSEKYILFINFNLILILLSFVVNCKQIEITGFGWHSPQLIFSSRYFFVWNESIDRVVITSPDTGCRVWHQIFNQTEFGSKTLTIIRYKLLSDVCLGGL